MVWLKQNRKYFIGLWNVKRKGIFHKFKYVEGWENCHSGLHNGPKLQMMHFMTVIKVKQTYGFLIYSYLKDRPFTAVNWDARICSIPPGNCTYLFLSNHVRTLMHWEFLSFTRLVFSQFFLFHLSCLVSRPWKVLHKIHTFEIKVV